MFKNPVYMKEVKSSSRSTRTIITILAFDAILAFAGLISISSVSSHATHSGSIDYSAMLELYILIATVEFILLLLIIPGLTSSTISGEKEHQTFELLLSTRISPLSIVIGKLEASLTNILFLILSSLPILSLVFIYGGILLTDLLLLLLVFFIMAVFIGSAGIMFSSIFKRTLVATVASYVFLFIISVISVLLVNGNKIVNSLGTYDPYVLYTSMQSTSVSWVNYIMLINPAITFYHLLNIQAGNPSALLDLMNSNGNSESNIIITNWLPISLFIQTILAILFLGIASQKIKNTQNK
ncbi:MAG: ABC transporter permease [Lachnospiraceae bacterium]